MKIKKYIDFINEMDQYANLKPLTNKDASLVKDRVDMNIVNQEQREIMNKVGKKPINDNAKMKELQKQYQDLDNKRQEIAKQITDFEVQSKQEEIAQLQAQLQLHQQSMQQIQQQLKNAGNTVKFN